MTTKAATDAKAIAAGLTKAQREALKWLADRGGDACFDKHGVAFAQGETAETTRMTWNALEKSGLIRFYGGVRDGGKGYGRLAILTQEQPR